MPSKQSRNSERMSRRGMLKASVGAGIALASGLAAAPAIASARSIRIGDYGGYFEDN